MASLLGKADATIAGMSLREAMADVMPDYSNIYKQEAEGFEKNQLAFQKAVGDYFDIQHADNNKLADELKEATTKAMQGLGTDYESMELFNSHLTSMKDRMKALPKNKKGDFERSKIRAEMNQLLESSVGLDDTLAKVGTMINAGEFNKHTTDYPALLAISKGEATKEIVDGNLVYTYKDAKGKKQTIDRQGIEDALGQSDLEIDGIFIKQGPEAFRLGKQGGKFNRNKSVNGYEKMFTSPAGLAANMNEKQGGLEYTFVESLAGKDGSESIYKALTNMGPTTVAKFDANNDKKITEADFADPNNGIALIESLTNPRSDNYNFQAAKTAAAEFYADNIDQVEFNDGKSLRPVKPGGGAGGNKTDTNPYGLSLSKKGKYGLGLPSKGTSYVPQYDTAYVTNKIDNLKSGSRIDFQGDNYTFREVDGVTQWWKNYGYGDDYGKKVEGVGIGTPIGTAKDMAEDVFYVGDDPIFNSIVTEREQEVPDDKTGLLPSDNQFADRQSVAEGQGQAAVVPTDFVDVFKKDFQSDLEVVKYLKNMNVPGLVVGTYQGNPDYNYPNNDNRKLVKASDTAYDDVVLTLNGKTKLFTTDPSFSDDTEGAQEIWNWLYENFSGTQAGVNNDYYNLVDKND